MLLKRLEGVNTTEARLFELETDLVHYLHILFEITEAHKDRSLKQFVEVSACGASCAKNFHNQSDLLDRDFLRLLQSFAHCRLHLLGKKFRYVSHLIVGVK